MAIAPNPKPKHQPLQKTLMVPPRKELQSLLPNLQFSPLTHPRAFYVNRLYISTGLEGEIFLRNTSQAYLSTIVGANCTLMYKLGIPKRKKINYTFPHYPGLPFNHFWCQLYINVQVRIPQ